MAGNTFAAQNELGLTGLLASLFQLKHSQESKKPLNVIVTSDDNFLAWVEETKQVLVISLKSITQENGQRSTYSPFFQKLSCSQMFPFKVTSINLSYSGQFLALSGEHGVGVLEMPKQWGRTSLYVGGKPNIICRSVVLAEDFFKRKFSVKVLQTAWFPGSSSDIHLLVLTSDNHLRCFDVREVDVPISTIKLFNNITYSNSFSLTNFAAALGEMAVSFTFAPPSPGRDDSKIYPIFVMQENGDTWTLWTKLTQNRLLAEQRGPLTMTPRAEDNYGGEFSSVLCLQTSPPIIVLATTSGSLYHCIVLESEQEGVEYEDELSSLRTGAKLSIRNLELFVYETFQLDLSLLRTEEQDGSQQNEQINKNIQLHEDKSALHRYFCVSSGGLHMINLPWANDLECFCLPDTNESLLDWKISTPAEISYILCTKPTEKSAPYQILGLSTISNIRDGTSLMCLLENGELVQRPIGGTDFEEDNCNDVDLEESSSNTPLSKFPSPLKKLKAAGSFDEYIKQIIKRDCSTPLIKSSTGNPILSPEEIYQMMTQSAGHLRQEYMQKLSSANNEISKRCEILKEHKLQQAEDLRQIINDQELSDNVECLADKLSTVSENMASLTERLDNVVRAVQSSAPVLSDVEREWSKECISIQQKVGHLRRCVQGIRRKHENLVLGSIPSKHRKSPGSLLNPTQLSKIKLYMNEQNNKIAELVDRVRTTDLQLES